MPSFRGRPRFEYLSRLDAVTVTGIDRLADPELRSAGIGQEHQGNCSTANISGRLFSLEGDDIPPRAGLIDLQDPVVHGNPTI